GDLTLADGYHFHPTLLDACLQVGKASLDAPDGSPATRELFLPRKLGRIRMYQESIPARFWAHGIQRSRGEDHVVFDILVYDDAGERVCDILGFKTEMMEHIRDSQDVENCLYRYQWEALDPTDTSAPDGTNIGGVLVLTDAGGVADQVVGQLRGKGHRVVCVRAGEAFQEQSPDEFVVAVDREDDYRRVLDSVAPMDTVIHAWSLDHVTDEHASSEDVRVAQRTGVLAGLKLLHQLSRQDRASIFVLTRDAQGVLPEDNVSRVHSSPLIGMARVAFNEHPQISWRIIDLPAVPSDDDLTLVLRELATGDAEQEVAYRHGVRYARRVSRVRAADLPRRLEEAVQADGTVLPYQLQIETPGILSNLALHRTVRRSPGPDEVEARVMAAGINFRNVMKALGMPIGNTELFSGYGEDFAGTVVRVGENVKHLKPGDEVVGLGAYTFRAYVTTHAGGLSLKPKHLSFADAATIPTVFLTANYALRNLANLEHGEKVLIHAGTGGVGQAAIQIAREMGLEIFTTAGSEEKRELCRSLG
ncbi:MAG: polyketide synthase dehydratase domain-containing protein, partial [Planctomycetales bacterium]|nr:polyketide synthase dehydratase domain-containing protein [Planctomycetales bacterium]